MAIADTFSKPFSIGTVFQKLFSVIGQGFIPIFVVTALMNSPILVISVLSVPTRAIGTSSFAAGFFSFGLGFLSFFLQILAQGILIFGAFRLLQGKSFDVGVSASHAIRRALALLGLSIIVAIAVGLGFALLIVPGLIIATMYLVAVPSCLVESKGVFDSLGRSQALTKGYRWQVAGIYFLLLVGSFAVLLGLGAIFGFAGIFGKTFISAIAQFIANTITSGFQAVLVAVIYSELRYVKEGVGIDEISNVFA